MSYEVSLDALGTSYSIPEAGQTNYANDLSLYLRDLATVVNDASGGSLVTPVFNVRTYGATGNGSTDDTAAINLAKAALLAASSTGGTLYFPAGTYKTTSTLQFGVAAAQSNVRIVGDGPNSIIKPTGAFSTTPVIEFRDCNYWSVTDIKVDASARTGSGDNILVDGCSYGYCTNATLVNSTRYGINITQVSGASPSTYNTVNVNVFSGNTTANTNISAYPNSAYNLSGSPVVSTIKNVRDYGAVGDGSADDTVAIQAAITAAALSGGRRGVVYLPAGRYKTTAVLTVPGSLGFTMQGDGEWASQIIYSGTAGVDVLIVNSSQFVTLQDFAIVAASGHVAGKMLFFDYNPLVNAASQFTLRNLWILTDATREGYDYGIYWSDAYGNNSEASYENVLISGFKENGVSLPGSQQKGHSFRNTQINGSWDGASTGANGGKFGIWANGGSFSFRDGGVGYVRKAAFSMNFPSEPITIDTVDMEGCWQIYGSGAVSSSLAGSGTRQCVSIRNCRYDVSATEFDDTGVIQVLGVGSATIENNSFYAGDGTNGQTLIALAPGFPVQGVSVRGNQFLTANSDAYDPIAVYGTAVFYRSNIDCTGNLFATGAEAPSYRNQALNIAKQSSSLFSGPVISSRAIDLFRCTLADLFFANAASQVVDFLTTQPKAITYTDWRAFLYNYVTVSTGATLTMRVGTTSGGDELMQDFVLGGVVAGDETVYYGDDNTERGTMMMTGGHMPDGAATSHVYVTVTASLGVLGNGSVSNITRGVVDFPVEYKLQPRFIL